jgi:hypothetical protein
MTGRKRRDFTNAFCEAQACLDFTDGNTHSSHFEEIGYSTFDPNKTILIHVAYVTRQQRTIYKALRSTIYFIPVTRRHRGTAHGKLTRSPSSERPEIGAAEFAKAVETGPTAVIPHDAKLFGAAANNGQMIAEVQPSGKINESFGELASLVTGRVEPRRQRSTLFEPIIAKLSRRKA